MHAGKDVYLYDAKTLTLISKYNSHKDLIKELKISSSEGPGRGRGRSAGGLVKL